MKSALKIVLAAVLCAATLSPTLSLAQEAAKPKASNRLDPSIITEFGGKKSATKGKRDAIMGFGVPTQITDILVKGGQEITKGMLLVKGDDVEDLAVLKLQKAKAETSWPVERAKKQADLAELEYKRLADIRGKGGSSEQEVERAKLTWDVAVVDIHTAEVNQTQEVIQVERLQARVDKLHLLAPFDGIVDNVLVDVGHAVNENEKVIRVVNVDQLIMDVPAPMEDPATQTLKEGDKAWVLLDVASAARVIEGKVIEVAPTTDLSSLTRRVRVEIPNPKGPTRILAGEPAYVRFTQPPANVMSKLASAIQAQQPSAQASSK
jgi:RND family efflux transporter MFP subunit